jgi:hypothetical protein
LRYGGVTITTSGDKKVPMRRLKVLKKGLSGQEVKQIKALAIDAGFQPDEVEVVDLVGEPDAACDGSS